MLAIIAELKLGKVIILRGGNAFLCEKRQSYKKGTPISYGTFKALNRRELLTTKSSKNTGTYILNESGNKAKPEPKSYDVKISAKNAFDQRNNLIMLKSIINGLIFTKEVTGNEITRARDLLEKMNQFDLKIFLKVSETFGDIKIPFTAKDMAGHLDNIFCFGATMSKLIMSGKLPKKEAHEFYLYDRPYCTYYMNLAQQTCPNPYRRGEWVIYIGDGNGNRISFTDANGKDHYGNLTLGKRYLVEDLIDDKIIVEDDKGFPVNGLGVRYDYFRPE